ncbi:MAG: hypothetical protein KBA31_22800 [Alphaproteobacteria bacterium]|nr:hypothetical protein [Alphaproteobacteria bacterium]
MSLLFRFASTVLVAAWTLFCVLAFSLVEILGEAFVDQLAGITGGTIASLVGFLHDIGMVLLVLVWLVVAWLIWTAGRMFGSGRSLRRFS